MEEFTQQLGERAIGVTKLMAKTLGITTPQLFKQMQAGKLNPEDMFKLADAMSKFAHSSQGYQEALNNSASAQERMKNAWNLFAYTVLESGLDEVLAGIFQGLSDLINVISPLIKYLISAAKGFIAIAKAVNALNLYMPILIGLIVLFRKRLFELFMMILIQGTQALASRILGMPVATGATAQLTAAFTALRAALMRLLPFLLLAGVIEVFNQLDKYYKGEDNWIHVLIGYFMLGISYVDLFCAKIEYLWALIKNAPRLGFDKFTEEASKTLGIGQSYDKSTVLSSINDPLNNLSLTQIEAHRRWAAQPNRTLWESIIGHKDPFTILEMQRDLGMGDPVKNTLEITILPEKGKAFKKVITLTGGNHTMNIPLGNAGNR